MITRWWWVYVLAWVVALWVAVALMARFVPFRNDFAFTSLQFYEPRLVARLPAFVTPWANFDGVHYLNKATHSLLFEPRFLPLYPAVIATMSFGFFDGTMTVWQVGAGITLSWISLATAVWFLYKLLRMDYSKNVAVWTIALLISFPTAFFFTGIYTESLFLCVAVLALFTAKKSYFRTSLFFVAVASM
ncbi:hypothetical protein KBC89_05170, partial [Candidatus Woesebacteria bacterium]|nr:hypothetical protein [Candidatus Woesebacteria bacterium]